MKIRLKSKPNSVGYSDRFNIHALSEIIVGFPEDGSDSDFIKNYEIFLNQKKDWKDMSQAFKDHDLIVDNYNTYFF